MRYESKRCWIRTFQALAVCAVWSGGSLFATSAGDGRILPCGMECFRTAGEAAAACREDGGDFLECSAVFGDELRACREEAGCEIPDRPDRPPLCGVECLIAARDAAIACREADGDPAECFAAVKAELRACLDEAGCERPTPPERPPHCGAGCLKEAVVAARDCLRNGDGLKECVGAFRAALEACRDGAGCNDDGDTGEPADEVDAQVLGLLLEETFTRGDANADGFVDLSDPIAVLDYLFRGGSAPICMDAADANDDGLIDISDPTMALAAIFRGTESLPGPYPVAGFDPTTEDPFTCGIP